MAEDLPAPTSEEAPPGVSRRRLLALLGTLGLLAPVAWLTHAGAGTWGSWWIRWRLRYLDLSQVDLAAYLKEYEYYLGFERPDLRTDLVTRLLLSTDFFRRGADEGRAPGYVGFYYPEILPCANPFAQAVGDDQPR